MSEEEKHAIEILKFTHDKCEEEKQYGTFRIYRANDLARAIEEILNLIEKQQKEIEKLEARKYMLNAETGEVTAILIDNNYISKDKIKAKIEEYKKQIEKDRKEIKESVLRSVVISDKEERIQELQSLLEESE